MKGITKRCCLSWLTNSALVYEPKCWGSGGGGSFGVSLSANEYSYAHDAQINFGDLTPYLTYGVIVCDIYGPLLINYNLVSSLKYFLVEEDREEDIFSIPQNCLSYVDFQLTCSKGTERCVNWTLSRFTADFTWGTIKGVGCPTSPVSKTLLKIYSTCLSSFQFYLRYRERCRLTPLLSPEGSGIPAAPAEAVYSWLYLRYCKGSRLTPLSSLRRLWNPRSPCWSSLQLNLPEVQ